MSRDLLSDPELPHLRTLADTAAMPGVFEAHFAEAYPERGLRVEATSIEKVYYRQGKHAGVLHRLELRDAHGRKSQHWFFVRHFRTGEGARRFEKAQRKTATLSGPWRPVSFWPELEMLAFAFPADTRLTQLPELARPETLKKLVEEKCAALGLAPASACHSARCEQVKYMPGKRCVLRLELEVQEPGAEPRRLAFYSKSYGDAQSRYVFEAMERARRAISQHAGPLEIPRSVLHLDDLHTYWQEEWIGEPLSRLYGKPEIEPALPRVAAALAQFHRMQVPRLLQAFYVEEVGAEAVEDAAKIGLFLPADAERVRELGERIAALSGELAPAAETPEVPLHGAFRMSQLLGRDERLAMTDFDAAALGDPHYDVAEFMSSLLYQHFRRDLPLDALEAQAERFREAYARCVPWRLHQRRLDWFLAAFVLEKFHGTLKGLELQILDKADAVFDLIEDYLQRASRPA